MLSRIVRWIPRQLTAIVGLILLGYIILQEQNGAAPSWLYFTCGFCLGISVAYTMYLFTTQAAFLYALALEVKKREKKCQTGD